MWLLREIIVTLCDCYAFCLSWEYAERFYGAVIVSRRQPLLMLRRASARLRQCEAVALELVLWLSVT